MSKQKKPHGAQIGIPVAITTILSVMKTVSAGMIMLDVITTLNFIQSLLEHIGPILSAILFIVAGVFYALGQLFPSHQRATFHTTAIDIIIGAIIIAVLSVASNGFALASTHLLSNLTNGTK